METDFQQDIELMIQKAAEDMTSIQNSHLLHTQEQLKNQILVLKQQLQEQANMLLERYEQ